MESMSELSKQVVERNPALRAHANAPRSLPAAARRLRSAIAARPPSREKSALWRVLST